MLAPQSKFTVPRLSLATVSGNKRVLALNRRLKIVNGQLDPESVSIMESLVSSPMTKNSGKFAATICTFIDEVKAADPENVEQFLTHDVFTNPKYKVRTSGTELPSDGVVRRTIVGQVETYLDYKAMLKEKARRAR